MGKIVKFCAACDESFAERFGFCPNCAQPLTAFEMNPVEINAPVAEEPKPSIVETKPTVGNSAKENSIIQKPAPVIFDAVPEAETSPAAKTIAFSANQTQDFSSKDLIAEDGKVALDKKVEKISEVPVSTKTFAASAGSIGNGKSAQPADYDKESIERKEVQSKEAFHVTVIEEKNGKQRNALLLGSMALMLTLALGSTVYSLFSKDFGVGAIEDGSLFAAIIVEDVPVEIEEQPKPKKDDKDGGGGGGGGKEEPEPASKGRLVSQSEKPITPPDAKSVQLTNPDIKLVYETKGTIKRPVTEERPGLPGSDNLNPSNGTGRGGGIGSGTGTGIGSGIGTGEGSGIGSGSGSGRGDGIGGGTGDGTGGRTPPPPPPSKPVEVVTVPFRIISKPRPGYTDAARQNQVTGVVRLRVTFSASGAIGSIAPVSGLPYGLTEQAIAAARQIKFEPAKKNGVAVASTKIIEYSFSIY